MMDKSREVLRGLLGSLDVRPVGLDDLSSVRYIHESAMRTQGSGHYTEAELEAFKAFVYSPQYADLLLKDVLLTGWIAGELVATSGWALPIERGEAARIRAVYVRPLFTGLGLGQRMLDEAEAEARKSGFNEFTARASINAVAFFETAGYEVASHGTRTLLAGMTMPVAFMRKSDEDAATQSVRHGTA